MSDLTKRARDAAQYSREFGPITNAPFLDELADEIERLETALKKIANDEVTHTKLNQERLCCKFQDIAMEALDHE